MQCSLLRTRQVNCPRPKEIAEVAAMRNEDREKWTQTKAIRIEFISVKEVVTPTPYVGYYGHLGDLPSLRIVKLNEGEYFFLMSEFMTLIYI